MTVVNALCFIQKVSASDSALAPIASMKFDNDYKSLIVLSEGKLSW